MAKQVPFIGREAELVQIDRFVSQWGTRRIICINGPGGIGKTRLLQEVQRRYAALGSEQDRLVVADIIDFDDTTYHLPLNLGRRIARELDEQAFEPYLRRLLDLRKMELAGVARERLNQETLALNQIFVERFNQVAQEKRILLSFDTTDALSRSEHLNFADTDVGTYIIRTGFQIENAVIMIAGRDARQVGELLLAQSGDGVLIIDLPPFSEAISEDYLHQKQAMLHVDLDPELGEKLRFLAGGRPILLDLAVAWQARSLPFDWLAESSLEELRALPPAELEDRRQAFERGLLHQIAETRRLVDWLILVMARVYPLDAAIIARLLDLERSEAWAVMEEALNHVFVKQLPDGRISLHDEMRRMVNTYLWPEIDPDGDRRRRDSRIAAAYLQERIGTMVAQIEELEAAEELARQSGDAQAELSAFMSLESLERALWVHKEQLLHHTLMVDLDAGVDLLAELFAEATRSYRFAVRDQLLAQIQPYQTQLSPAQRYTVDSRRVKHLLDRGDYRRAQSLVSAVLETLADQPQKQIDMLIERGNAEIRLGNLDRGIADFEQAVQISQQHNLEGWLVRASNARGWAYRLQGNFDLALEDYLNAYQLSLKLGDRQRTAWILNNMGYVNAYKGNQQAALENCDAALALWDELDFGRGRGATYSNLGEIHMRFGRLDDALTYYGRAMDIFTEEADTEWISIVRCGRAVVERLRGHLDAADEDLAWALDNGPLNLRPRILYNQAHILWARQSLPQAQQVLQHCRQVSRRVGDSEYDGRSLADLISLAWEFGRFEQWSGFLEEVERVYADRSGDVASRLHGSSLRKVADLAICEGAYEAALDAYKTGLAYIARYEVHQPYTVGAQLKETESRLHKVVSGAVIARLGRDLGRFWSSDPVLFNKAPGLLTTFSRWEREGATE